MTPESGRRRVEHVAYLLPTVVRSRLELSRRWHSAIRGAALARNLLGRAVALELVVEGLGIDRQDPRCPGLVASGGGQDAHDVALFDLGQGLLEDLLFGGIRDQLAQGCRSFDQDQVVVCTFDTTAQVVQGFAGCGQATPICCGTDKGSAFGIAMREQEKLPAMDRLPSLAHSCM